MVIAASVVLFLALFFSLMFVVKIAEFVVTAVMARSAKFSSALAAITALLWAIFYCLVAW